MRPVNFLLRNIANTRVLYSRLLHNLNEFSLSADNTLISYLVADPQGSPQSQFRPRQVSKAHFTFVHPEPVPNPYFIVASKSCAEAIGLDPVEFENPLFTDVFSGNYLLPGFNSPYCTVYGCHCYGQWFGQLGDGRAMALGEVMSISSDPNGNYFLYIV